MYDMPLKAIYFDTETTGIKPEKDRIIEIAAYDPEKDTSFVSFINPQMLIPPEATAIHNITNAMVEKAPPFNEVAIQFMEFCGSNSVLIAHNNDAFDKVFLHMEFTRSQVPLPSWKYLDTLKWSRKYRPDLPKHSLQFLREVYGIAANQAHRALDDVKVLHQVFSHMIGDLTIDRVVALLEEKRSLQKMPFGKYQGKALREVPKDYLAWLKSSGALDKPENKPLLESLLQASLIEA